MPQAANALAADHESSRCRASNLPAPQSILAAAFINHHHTLQTINNMQLVGKPAVVAADCCLSSDIAGRDVIKTRESETKTRQVETKTKTREAETSYQQG